MSTGESWAGAACPLPGGSCCSSDAGERRVGDLTWFRVALALAFAGQGMVFGLGYNNALAAGEAPPFGSPVYWALHGGLFGSALAVILLLGRPLLLSAFEALRARQVTVEGLFLLTATGALVASILSSLRGVGSVYYEVVGLVLAIYTVGRKVGAGTRAEALAAAGHWRDAFNFAFLETASGNRRRVAVAEVTAADTVVVLPGEAVAVDGVVLAGTGEVRETIATGELLPALKRPGDLIFAGSYATDAELRIRPTRRLGERTLDHILSTVESAALRPSRYQSQADQLMRWFLPLVAGISLATFLGWSLGLGQPWADALFHAMAVLLVACPCALGLATPIAVWTGLLTLSRHGLVGRHGAILEGLAEAQCWFFDKTGTLSAAELVVSRWILRPPGPAPAWLQAAVASLEASSTHPLGRTLARASTERLPVSALRVIPGAGLEGTVDGHRLQVGRHSWLAPAADPADADDAPPAGIKRHLAVALDGVWVASIELEERLSPQAEASLAALRRGGAAVHILTGDDRPVWSTLAGITVESGLSPDDKRARVAAAVAAHPRGVVYVGDGLNDAAALSVAHVGLAVDGGDALTTAAADGVLPGAHLAVLPWAVAFCRHLRDRLRGNLIFALAYNAIGILLAAFGWLHPVAAALLMVGSSAFVSWRASRLSAWAQDALPDPSAIVKNTDEEN